MLNRRIFIKNTLLSLSSHTASSLPFDGLAASSKKVTILHTNDTHSRMKPFPIDGGKYQGLGGVEARAALIDNIRSQQSGVLLLDAGDIFQGTPFFNLYNGEPEIKAMSKMGYDACTMGNHDFDGGIENFARQLAHANFPVLVANYDFTHTPLEHKIHPHYIFNRGGIKIGVFGLGIELDGLVPADAYGGVKYIDPIAVARQQSELLKRRYKCDMVICLSHLGFDYGTNKVSDKIIAAETQYIDLIIGGHTHTFLDQPFTTTGKTGKKVTINQVGWAGVKLGRLDFSLHKSNLKMVAAHRLPVGSMV